MKPFGKGLLELVGVLLVAGGVAVQVVDLEFDHCGKTSPLFVTFRWRKKGIHDLGVWREDLHDARV